MHVEEKQGASVHPVRWFWKEKHLEIETYTTKLIVNPLAICAINDEGKVAFVDGSWIQLTKESARKVRAYLREKYGD